MLLERHYQATQRGWLVVRPSEVAWGSQRSSARGSEAQSQAPPSEKAMWKDV